MFEAALYQKVAKAIYHQRVSLCNDGLDNLEFLFHGANLELLLQENGSLLVVIADDFVDDVFPVARNATI